MKVPIFKAWAYDKLISQVKIDYKNGCWLYGEKNNSNLISHDFKTYVASRLSFAYHNKLAYDDPSWDACHIDELCSNKNCVNPHHMYRGTNSTNMLDAVKKRTHVQARKTQCPKNHPYDMFTKSGQRYCSICRNEQRKEKRRLGIWK